MAGLTPSLLPIPTLNPLGGGPELYGNGQTTAGPITGRFGRGNIRIFYTSGTFTPEDAGPYEVRLWGGGANGAASTRGAGGGFAIGEFDGSSGIVAGVPITVTVSPAEGTSSFGALISATGGVGATPGVGVGGYFQSSGSAMGRVGSLFGNQFKSGADGSISVSLTAAVGVAAFYGQNGSPGNAEIDYIGTGGNGSTFTAPNLADYVVAGNGSNGGAAGIVNAGANFSYGDGGFPGGGGSDGSGGAPGLVIVRW